MTRDTTSWNSLIYTGTERNILETGAFDAFTTEPPWNYLRIEAIRLMKQKLKRVHTVVVLTKFGTLKYESRGSERVKDRQR